MKYGLYCIEPLMGICEIVDGHFGLGVHPSILRVAMLRRLEDRIRELSQRVASAHDTDELKSVVIELRFIIHQHVQRVRARAFSGLDERRTRPHKRMMGGEN